MLLFLRINLKRIKTAARVKRMKLSKNSVTWLAKTRSHIACKLACTIFNVWDAVGKNFTGVNSLVFSIDSFCIFLDISIYRSI